MKKKSVVIASFVTTVIVFLTIMTFINQSNASILLPDNVNGTVYRNNYTITIGGANVTAKNLSTEIQWGTTADGNGDYTVFVNAGSGANFNLKASAMVGEVLYTDNDTKYHPGNNSGLNHDFSCVGQL